MLAIAVMREVLDSASAHTLRHCTPGARVPGLQGVWILPAGDRLRRSCVPTFGPRPSQGSEQQTDARKSFDIGEPRWQAACTAINRVRTKCMSVAAVDLRQGSAPEALW